jgi:hypothetical protein
VLPTLLSKQDPFRVAQARGAFAALQKTPVPMRISGPDLIARMRIKPLL